MIAEANAGVLAAFLDYLRIEKGLARLSIGAYTTDLLQFAEFLLKRKRDLMTARRIDVREFLQQLFSNRVDGRSVGRKLSALRHLYRYLLLNKRIVPLGRPAQDALTEYLTSGRPVLATISESQNPRPLAKNARRAGHPSTTPFLFIARGGRKLTRQRVWQMVGQASAA